MLPDCEVYMIKSDWRSILLAILTGLLANILGTEYQIRRLPGNIDEGNKPHVETVAINDTLPTGTIQCVKVIVEVKFNRQ